MIEKLDSVNLKFAFPEVAFDDDYIIGTYQVRIKTKNIEQLAEAVADEQSTGTWIRVGHDSDLKTKDFGAKVVSIYEVPDHAADRLEDLPPLYIIQLAFPVNNMGDSLPMMMSTVFGNIAASGMLKWIDAAFPKKYVAKFQGPKFGVEGIRRILDIHDRPLLNAMIKPNIGWTPDEGAEIFYQAAAGGVDIIKDDELLPADAPYCPLEERVEKMMEMERRAYEETGEHTLYAVNITDDPSKIKDNAMRALDKGANCLMLNTYTAGLGMLRSLTDDPDINVPVLAHSDFVGAYSASTFTGISSPLVMGKIARLAGGDMQIGGHPWGKFPIPYPLFMRTFRFFTQPWWNIRPMFYLFSGGTTQLSVAKAVSECGIDVIVAAGGAVHGHPDGSRAGARSMRQAMDAAVKGIDLTEYAKTAPELISMLQMLDPEIQKNFALMN